MSRQTKADKKSPEKTNQISNTSDTRTKLQQRKKWSAEQRNLTQFRKVLILLSEESVLIIVLHAKCRAWPGKQRKNKN